MYRTNTKVHMKFQGITKETTSLQRVLEKLGPGQSVVKDAIAALAEQNIHVSKSAIYQVVNGRSSRRELVEAFLAAAEAETHRRELVELRAAKLTA